MDESAFEFGNRLLEGGQYDKAIVAYHAALVTDPENEQLQANLSYAYLMSRRYLAGVEHINDYLGSRPVSGASFDVIVNLALLHNGLGESERALELLAEARRKDLSREELYIALAEVLSAQGAYKQVIETLCEAQLHCGQSANLHNYIGSFYNDKLGDHKLALVHFNLAHGIAGDEPRILNNLGITQVAVGQFKEAAENFSRAIQIKPDYCQAYHNLSVALYNGGRYQECAALLDEILEKYPVYAAETDITAMRNQVADLLGG